MENKNIDATDLINARVYRNEDLYQLSLELVNISSSIQSISNVAKYPEYKDGNFSAELVAEWVDEIQVKIQKALGEVVIRGENELRQKSKELVNNS